MNPNQLSGILRLLAPTIIGIATTYFGAGPVNVVLAILTAFVGAAGASFYSNTTSNLVQSVAAVPGVQVAATREAPEAVQKLANDPNVPDVVSVSVPLTNSPPHNPYSTQRKS